MRKLLSLFAQTILISSFGFSIIACYNPLANNGGNNDNDQEITPPPPPTKDIKYYETLINEKQKAVNIYNQSIKEIQEEWDKNENENIPDEAFQAMIDRISIDLYTNQEQINEYQYQILLLNKKDNKFTSNQVSQGINIFKEKIKNLKELLKIKEKYSDDYPKSTLEDIKTSINEAKEKQEFFEKLKEEEGKNKCYNLFYQNYQY